MSTLVGEVVIQDSPLYHGRVLTVPEGWKSDWYYHKDREKTVFVQSGLVRLRYLDRAAYLQGLSEGWRDEEIYRYAPVKALSAGGSVHVSPGTLHEIEAVIESVIVEFGSGGDDEVERC